MPAERLSQQSGQLRVSVRDVPAAPAWVGQRRDDIAQREERLVDVRRFLESVASGATFHDPLRAGQIDEAQPARRGVPVAVQRGEVQRHHAVRARRVFVEQVRPHLVGVRLRGWGLGLG